jgi:TetR/AcrR family transcriptional regulator, mexJK operon transcriptional repressor
MSVDSTTTEEAEPRAVRKRRAILDAAGEVFLRNGYVGTSMDEIAAVAAVSKQTVYKHFTDKATLFHELIAATVGNTDGARGHILPSGGGPIDEELRAFARHFLHGVMQPRVLQVRRLVIGEATRFPALGRAFYDMGLATMIDTLATSFARLADQGRLQVDDPRLAAEHFVWLVLSIPLNRAMLLGDDHGVSIDDLDRYADAGVSAFLAAYARQDPPTTPPTGTITAHASMWCSSDKGAPDA